MNSYILKVKIGESYYIINRNETFVDKLLTEPDYVKFFGLDAKKFHQWLLSNVEILATYPIDNKNHSHQKLLNTIKEEYRNKLGGEINDSPIIDETLTEQVKSRKKKIKELYNKIDKEADEVYNSEELMRKSMQELILKNKIWWNDIKKYNNYYIYKNWDKLFNNKLTMLYYIFRDRYSIKNYAEKWRRYCYGWYINNKELFSSFEDCIEQITKVGMIFVKFSPAMKYDITKIIRQEIIKK